MTHDNSSGETPKPTGFFRRVLSLSGQVLVGVVIVSFVLFAISTLRQPTVALDQAERPAPIPVETRLLVAEDGYIVPRHFVGRVVARQETLASFELAGRLIEILVDEGDSVAEGQTIARLDTDLLRASLDELTSREDELEAQVELAMRTEERQQELNRRGHTTDQRLDESFLERIALEAALEQARAGIRNVEIQIDKAILRAPFDGTVGERMTDVGTVVSAGQPVVDIIQSGAMEARIGIPAPLADGIEVGEVFQIDVGDRVAPAVVHTLRRDIDRQTQTVVAVLLFQDDIDVPSGEIARLTIDRYHAEPGFWVPVSALTQGLAGLWSVFVVQDIGHGDTIVQREETEILHFDADRVFVRGTFSAGSLVITAGVDRVTPGQLVLPITATIADNG